MKTRKKSLRRNRGPAATLEATVGGSDTRKRETCGLGSSPAMEEELPFAGCDIPETVSATASPETVEKELPDPTRQQAASFTIAIEVWRSGGRRESGMAPFERGLMTSYRHTIVTFLYLCPFLRYCRFRAPVRQFFPPHL